MKTLAKYAIAAVLAGGTAMGAAQPANAHVGVSIGIGVPGYYGDDGYYGDSDYSYDYSAPCSYYRYYDLPAPGRCYSYFYGFYGPALFWDSGFIFRDHDDFWRWHGRSDWQHWRAHDFGTGHWAGRGGFNGGHANFRGGSWGGHGSWSGGHGGWSGGHGSWGGHGGGHEGSHGGGGGHHH